MKRTITILTLGLLLAAISVQAQETNPTTRLERQHTKYTHFQKGQMKQTEASLLAAITSESVSMQQSAIQAVRDLEELVADYPFNSLVAPLADKLRRPNTDQVTRQLAALALDELHSDAGDAVIKEVAANSNDKSLQTLCRALLVRSNIQ